MPLFTGFLRFPSQGISQDLQMGHPNLLFFERQGVQNFNLQYINMCFVHLANWGSKRHPKVLLANSMFQVIVHDRL